MAEPRIYKTKLDEFKTDQHNHNRHTQRGQKVVENSMRKRGYARPGFAANDGTILGGNLSTGEVAPSIGLGNGEVIVIETDGDIPIIHKRRDVAPGSEAARLLAIEDNRSAEVSLDWNAQEIKLDLDNGIDLSSMFTDGELIELGVKEEEPKADPGAQVDQAEELREKWGVETGQLWKLGEHRLICGDCTDKTIVDRVMGGEKAQIIFTDPPYGVDYDGGAKKREKLDGDEVGAEIYALALPILASAADDNAPLYLWYADGHAAAAAAAAAAAGYQISAQIIWAKNQAQFVTSAHYKGKHEPCYYAHKKGKSARWHGPNNEVTLWEYDRSPRNDFHPTQKPIELAERAIRNSSEVGHIVIDGFLGGGTTLIACERLGRKCRAVEISPAYCAVTLQRFYDMTGITPILA